MKTVQALTLLIMSILTLSSSEDKVKLDFENDNTEYYCVYVSYLKLTMDGSIRSLKHYNKRIEYL